MTQRPRFLIAASAVALTAGVFAVPALAQSADPSAPAPTAAPGDHTSATPIAATQSATATVPGQTPDAAPGQAGDIIVTAQRRSQRLQDVPVVVTALPASVLAEKGITSTVDLPRITPGLTNFVANGFVMPSLRGVGSQINAAGSTGTVPIYLDGVYLSSPQAALFSFNNIEQIEVDKGPQGTLFGRNATAGVIQVTTRDPRATFGGNATVGIDNYATLLGSLYLTGPVAQHLAADIAVHYSDQRNGYGRNLLTGNDIYKTRDISARTKWVWTPADGTRIAAIVDYSDVKDSSDTIQLDGVPYDYGVPGLGERLQSDLGSRYNIYTVADPLVRTKQGGVSLEASHDFGGVQLTNIAAYRGTNSFILSPTLVAPYSLIAYQDHKYRQASEEIRLSSPKGSSIAWVAGFYYLYTKSTNEPYTFVGVGSTFVPSAPCTARLCPPYLRSAPGAALGTTTAPAEGLGGLANTVAFNTFVVAESTSASYAGFAQTTLPLRFIVPSLNLTLGLRYTSETVGLVGQDLLKAPGVTYNPADRTFNKLTYKVGLDYHFTPEIMGYATYSRGFQAGFFNANTPTAPASEPQTIDDYEAGLKTSFFDRRLTFNVGGFLYNYTNIVQTLVLAGLPTTTNGPKARLYGLDADLSVKVTDRFQLNASLEYLRTRWISFPGASSAFPASPTLLNNFCRLVIQCNPLGGVVSQTFDATGNQLPYAPTFVSTVSPSYSLPLGGGELQLSGSWYHSSGYFNDASNTYGQSSYNLFDAQAQWRPGNKAYWVRVWGKNLSDKEVFARMSTSAPFGEFHAESPPRTYGVSVGLDF